MTKVLAESVQFLEPRNSSNKRREQPSQKSYAYSGVNSPGATRNDDPFANTGNPIDISDDDLPF